MPLGRASVPFPQRWRVAHGIPTLARGNEETAGITPLRVIPQKYNSR